MTVPAGGRLDSNSSADLQPAARLTPMMAQYWDVKKAHREAIVLFRMGDFYETFYEDARVASRVLGVALTTRDRNSAQPVPLAGVPFHSVDTYIGRLLRAGYKVAICDQVEDPALAKGLVRRAVTEVLTPGTALTPSLLSERDSHYALCLWPGGEGSATVGFACLDFSTGEFALGERPASEALDIVARYSPGEVFLPRAALGGAPVAALGRRFEAVPVSYLDDASFTRIATETLTRRARRTRARRFRLRRPGRWGASPGALLEAGTRLKRGRLQAVTRLQVARAADERCSTTTLANLRSWRCAAGSERHAGASSRCLSNRNGIAHAARRNARAARAAGASAPVPQSKLSPTAPRASRTSGASSPASAISSV
jgi:DNA mismatch repair protein MutS